MRAQFQAEIDKALANGEQLPSMSATANRVISMAFNPDVDIKLLAEEITRDPGITASVIRLANSAYFAPSRKIRSVQEAIVILGLETLKSIVVIAASRGILKVPMEGYRMEDNALWEHSLLVAEICLRIAKTQKTKTPPDVAFTAGLLHDVGKVILSQYFRGIYRQITMEMDQNPSMAFSELEKKYLGYNHNEISGKLLAIWNFPEELVEAVIYNYEPNRARVNPELCSIVHLGNSLSLAAGIGVDIGGLKQPLNPFALETLRMDSERLKELYARLPELIEAIQDLRSL